MNVNIYCPKLKITCFLALLLPLFIQGQNGPGINFETKKWDEIKAQAKSQNKLIFMDLYATWCSPCKRMDKEVYSNDSVADYVNQNFVSTKIQLDSTHNDSEDIQKMYAFAKKISIDYKISSLPTLLFFDSNGRLIHRDQGLIAPDKLVEICKIAANHSENYVGQLNQYLNGLLTGSKLITLALNLKRFREDSLASAVATHYKLSVLEPASTSKVINSESLILFREFPSIFQTNDSIIQYIYLHPREADDAAHLKNFSQKVVDYLATRDIIAPKMAQADYVLQQSPSWDEIERCVAAVWDKATAQRVIINNKIDWYTKKKIWDSVAKYQIAKIEYSNLYSDAQGAAQVNDIVWNVIFKHISNNNILNKACGYMEIIVNNNPNNFLNIDTYANILYKMGQTEKALQMERKALALALSSRRERDARLYKDTIDKMQKGIPTW